MERQIHLFIGAKAPTGLNIKLKHYGRGPYEAFTNLTA